MLYVLYLFSVLGTTIVLYYYLYNILHYTYTV